jgi:hypothetical protein
MYDADDLPSGRLRVSAADGHEVYYLTHSILAQDALAPPEVIHRRDDPGECALVFDQRS